MTSMPACPGEDGRESPRRSPARLAVLVFCRLSMNGTLHPSHPSIPCGRNATLYMGCARPDEGSESPELSLHSQHMVSNEKKKNAMSLTYPGGPGISQSQRRS